MNRKNVEDIYLLPPTQHSMLMYLLLEDRYVEVYFEQYSCALVGTLNPKAWREAWQAVLDRHTALRTQFLWAKRTRPLQVVRRRLELPWDEHDWRDLSSEEQERRWSELVEADQARGMKLDQAPLMRCALAQVSEDRFRFLWTFSHMLVDGWSMALVLSEVTKLYRAFHLGVDAELPPAEKFRDYVAWTQKQELGRAESFWRRELAGFDVATPLPLDGTGDALRPDERRSAQLAVLVDDELVDALNGLVRRSHTTLSTLFQAAWALVLAGYNRLDDVTFGALCSGRPAELLGIERMVGLFINSLPARVRIDPNQRFDDWLTEIQEAQAELRQYEYIAGEQIRAWSDLPHREEVFKSVVIFENYPVNESDLDDCGFTIEETRMREAGNFAFCLVVSPQGGQLKIGSAYHRDRFDTAAILQLLASVEAVVRAFVDDPQVKLGDIQLLNEAERETILAAGYGTAVERSAGLLHQPFEEMARQHPRQIALAADLLGDAPRQMSYAELEVRSRALAIELRRMGVGPEVVVGLVGSRCMEVFVGMLGVLRAGGAYLPLDPAYPADRLAFMLEDSQARILVVAPDAKEVLATSQLPRIDLDAATAAVADLADLAPTMATPDNLAAIIYTSGSTGRPKGVGVPHATALHYSQDSIEVYGVGPRDRLLQFSSIAFDTSFEEIYPALSTGATLVLRDDLATDFLSRAGEQGITVLNLPTAFWGDLALTMAKRVDDGDELAIPESLRVVIIGGEEAKADHVESWRRAVASVRSRTGASPPALFNTYGPTEATVVTTRAEITHPREGTGSLVSIGRPIANASAHLLTASMNPVPVLADGELFLGGLGLTRGYLGRPAETAAAFLPDPFGDQPGARLYRSGDLARRRRDGELEFRGRIDNQVKVRGYRIELGEIEMALRAFDGVRDAVVIVRGDDDGGDRIVAYWVAAGDGAAVPSAIDLRAALVESLPRYMIPAYFIELQEIPLTATGKIDRRALPSPGPERPELTSGYRAPRNPVEEVLSGIWCEILGVERIGVEDDFFELGGHSLLVARLTGQVRSTLGAELPMTAVFDHPTVAELAQIVAEAGAESASGPTVPELPALIPLPRDGRKIPLSFPQERVWFLDRLSGGGNRAYNFQVTLWLSGALDVGAFHRTLEEIVRRHEVLRTSFPEVDGEPVQRIHPPSSVPLPVVDLSGLPLLEVEETSERLVAIATQTAFDLGQLPLIRWWLLRLATDHHELIQLEQHFVHDGWSFAVMLREMKAIYGSFLDNKPSPLPELPVQYADYALWQRSWMEGEVMEQMLDYWKGQLEGAPTALELPTDRPRSQQPSFEGEMELHQIPSETYQALREFGRREGFTLYMTALAAFYVLLYRYSGQSDILVGTTNANRRTPEMEKLLGMIVNSLVMRGRLGGDPTFREFLMRVRETTLGAYNYQDMPLERLVREIDPQRHVGRNPLFQVLFQFHDAAIPDLSFPGGIEGKFLVRGNRTAKMDLTVIIIPRAEQRVGSDATDEGMRALLHWEYSTELFDETTISRMVGHYLTLLTSVVADPQLKLSELRMLSEEETLQLTSWNETHRRPAPAWVCVAEPFAHLCRQRPQAPAVAMALSEGAGTAPEGWSYGELDRRCEELANRLRALGVGPEVLVAVSLSRSPWMVVALLAVAKLGAAYLPLDPDYPAQRRAFMLEDSGAVLLLTERALLERSSPPALEEGLEVVVIDSDGGEPSTLRGEPTLAQPVPANLAYVIYTSGSTGRPKGVAVTYGALANFLTSMARQPGFSAADRLLAVTTLSFDIAGLELLLPWVTGGQLVIADAATASSGSRLAAAIESSRPTVMQATPATWRMLLDAEWKPPEGLKLLVGGEALPPALVAELASSSPDELELWNLYGPTETTVWSIIDQIDVEQVAASGKVAIGHPIDNTGSYVASERWELAPIGVIGQLLIGGAGLARGYRARPSLTADRFRPDPFSRRPGERLYLSGDLVRRREDGRLDYLGRLDDQVKVRGFRIELGEVEAALVAHPQINQAVVVARAGADGVGVLVAYLVAVSAAGAGVDPTDYSSTNGKGAQTADGPEVGELIDHLRQILPAYMVPSSFVMLDALPLTPNGKVDRKALPDAGAVLPPPAQTEYREPRTALEGYLVELWSEVLGVEPIGLGDSFFVLGGHSLAAGRVLARVRDRLGVDLPLSVIFDTPTVEALAAAVEAAGGSLDEVDQALQAKAAAMSDVELDLLLGEMLLKEEAR